MSHYVKPPSRQTSLSTPQVNDATSGRAAGNLARQVANNLQSADISRINGRIAGNAADAVKDVTFQWANRDVFVSHGFGYRVDNFSVESPSAPAHFSLGSKPPNIFGMWIRCDTAGVKARIRMKGQRDVHG